MRCPYCDAEVSSADLFCGECGKRLPTTPRKGRQIAIPLIIGIVAVVIVGCIVLAAAAVIIVGGGLPLFPQASLTPTVSPRPTLAATPTLVPTPSVVWLTYESDELGISIQYPQGWFMEEDPFLGQVMFAENEDDLGMDNFLTGTSFGTLSGTVEEVGMGSAQEALQLIAGLMPEEYADVEIGEISPCRIDNQDGAIVMVEGEFDQEGVQLRAWIAAAIVDDYVYMLLAGAPVEDWEEQGPILQAMLDSVKLSPPLVITPSPVPITPSPVSGADAYEPDDSIEQAKPITTDGIPQAHNLHVEGDHDYVSFVAEEGTSYTIETLNLGSNMDTIIYLYGNEGNELVSDDDGADQSLASRILWIAPSSATYYVMIRDLAEDSAGADTTYDISVAAGAMIEGDPYEPDDTMAQARPIDTDGTHQTHTFHTSADVDHVYFAAQEGVEYVIETGNPEGDCDTRIFLYDEDGEELDWDDDSGEGFASRLVWTPDSSGSYYVKVEDFYDQAGPEVSYEIWVSSLE
jgi:hypothetical protein